MYGVVVPAKSVVASSILKMLRSGDYVSNGITNVLGSFNVVVNAPSKSMFDVCRPDKVDSGDYVSDEIIMLNVAAV